MGFVSIDVLKTKYDFSLISEFYKTHSDNQTKKEFSISNTFLFRILDFLSIKRHTKSENTKYTNIEKYGCENVFQNKDVKEKIKNSVLEKYGVENPQQADEVKKKLEKTCLARYGVRRPNCFNEIFNKVKETNKTKYGVDNQFKRKDYLKNRIEEKYGSTEEFNKQISAIRKQSFLDKYGVDNPSQIDFVKEKKKNSSIKTFRDRYGVDYSVLLPCVRDKKGNPSDTVPNNTFASLLDENSITYNKEFPLQSYSYDFKIDDILVEINPSATHNSNWSPHGDKWVKKQDYHFNKSKTAMDNGYRCVCVWDWDNLDAVVELLKDRDVLYARKCVVKEISEKDASEFLAFHHVQGNSKARIFVGLFYLDELVSVMTFGKPRYNNKFEFELIRYCSIKNVVGGAEKLFSYFVKKYNPKSVISYCDLSKFSGKVYDKLGFILKDTSISKHWYNIKTKKHITDNLLRQRGFDQLLGNIYGKFGKGTNNEELMLQHGFVEIYDCGQATYVYFQK